MIAHAILLNAPSIIKGVAALSGKMANELFDPNKNPDFLEGFPVFVSHGLYDDTLPVQNGRAIQDFYLNTPANFLYKEYPMGHEINSDCLSDLCNWFKNQLDILGDC